MLTGHFVEGVPYNGFFPLDHLFGRANGVNLAEFLQPADDKRFEKNQGHLLRQSALVELQFRSDHDDRTSGVIDAFSEKIHPETTGLPL